MVNHHSSDDVGNHLVLDRGNLVTKRQLALFEPGYAQLIATGVFQSLNGRIDIPMFNFQLIKAREKRLFDGHGDAHFMEYFRPGNAAQ